MRSFTRRSAVHAAIAILGLCPLGLLSIAQKTSDPERDLWSALKKALMADNGDDYFRLYVKNSEITPLKGVVTAVVPNGETSKLMIALSNAETAEIALILRPPIISKIKPKPGVEVEFVGVALSFTKAPFMLTVEAVQVIPFSSLP